MEGETRPPLDVLREGGLARHCVLRFRASHLLEVQYVPDPARLTTCDSGTGLKADQ